MKRALPLLGLGTFALGFAGAFASCGHYESCDPGMVMQYNICLPGLVLGDAARPDLPPDNTCMPPPIPDGGAPVCDQPASGFGDKCTDTSQCRCGKDLCAIIPGESCGFCTRSACLGNPGICPPGWTCFDASAFQPGYSLCINM